MTAGCPCRTYIVYQQSLFAQGLRSLLTKQGGVQVVGMADDVAKAVRAVRSLRPDVILVEEPSKKDRQWRFLQLAAAAQVVILSLENAAATVYEQRRIPMTDPADLLRTLRGGRTRQRPRLPRPAP